MIDRELLAKIHALPPHPFCRDCADDGPICPNLKFPCDPEVRVWANDQIIAYRARLLAEIERLEAMVESITPITGPDVEAQRLTKELLSHIKAFIEKEAK